MKYIILILFFHWLADFVFQTDEMAINKSKSNYWLFIHASVYTIIMAVCALILFSPLLAIAWVLINGSIHYGQDYVTSRLNSKLKQDNKNHYFFVSIGFDQFLHFTFLLLTYELLK